MIRPTRRALWAALSLTLTAGLAAGCREAVRPEAAPVVLTPPARSSELLQCTVRVKERDMGCTTPTAAGGASRNIIMGNQGVYVRLVTVPGSVSWSSQTEILQADVTVQNLIEQTLGTLDGTTLDPGGVRVFFASGPTTTSGSGDVTVANASGIGTFTEAAQPYFQYDEMLATNVTSAAKTWQFNTPSTVGTFTFTVYVSTEVQWPQGYVTVTPNPREISAGATLQLTGAAKSAVGNPVPGTLAWNSSDNNVATVDQSGLVTAVADGSVTITASDGTRSGNAVVTVNTPSAANTTIAAAPPLVSYAVDSAMVTVQLRNATGGVVNHGGSTVVLNTGHGTLSAVVDSLNGKYTASLKATSIGTATVTGTLDGNPVTSFAVVEFTGGPATAMAAFAGTGQVDSVAALLPVAPAVRVTDASGDPVKGVAVTFTAAAGNGSVTGGSQTTNANGVATVGSWTLGTNTGVDSLVATSSVGTVTITANVNAGSPAQMTKSAGDTQSDTVAATLGTQPQVHVSDLYGNAVAGASVTFTAASGNGGVTGSPATTNAGGNASVTWTLSTAAKVDSLTASVTGVAPVRFTATASHGTATQLTKTAGDTQADTIEKVLTTAPQVRVMDKFNNPISGVSITFAATASNGTVTGGSATTSATGFASVGSWRLGLTAKVDSLTASATGLTTAVFTATVSHGNAVSMTNQVPLSQTSTKGAAVPAAKLPSVKIADRGGNGISGLAVTYTVAAGDGTIGGTTPSTDAAGVATLGSWTLPNANGRANQVTASRSGFTSVVFTITGN